MSSVEFQAHMVPHSLRTILSSRVSIFLIPTRSSRARKSTRSWKKLWALIWNKTKRISWKDSTINSCSSILQLSTKCWLWEETIKEKEFQSICLVLRPISKLNCPLKHQGNGWRMMYLGISSLEAHFKSTKSFPYYSQTYLLYGVWWTQSITRRRKIWMRLKPISRAICYSPTSPKFFPSWES